MNDLFEQPDDATPLTPDEMRDLIPAHIAYRRELNEAEQENIARAQDWALNRRRDPLSEKFVKDLHRRMFGDVWRWAGRFRMSERNLGIVFHEIPVALRQLLDDTRAWIEYRTYPPRRDRRALPSPAGADSSVPEWQRSPRPPHGGSSGDEARGGPAFVGKRQSTGCRDRAPALYRRTAGRR